MGGSYPPMVWYTRAIRDGTVGLMKPLHRLLARNMAVARIGADPHVLLAAAVVFAAVFIELVAGEDVLGLVVPAAVYLAIQVALAVRGPAGRSSALDTARLLVAFAAVFWMSLHNGDLAAMPLSGLYLPIVAMAAALGTRQ